MNLRHVEAFRAVCSTNSMTDAARQLHTSQPQISRLIGQLEEIVGFALFHRNGSRLTLSLEGSFFEKDVDRTFAGLAALEASAARIRSFGASKLTVAAMPRLAGGVLARAVARFKGQFPDVMVSIQSGDAASINGWISSGLCDCGIAMVYGLPRGVRLEPVRQISCVAVLPANHPLCELEQITAGDFDGRRFVSPPSGSPLHDRLTEAFTAAGAHPLVTAEASLGTSICSLVAAGLGASVINEWAAVDELRGGGDVVIKPFRPDIHLDVVLLFPEHREQSLLVRAFSDCVIEMLTMEDGGF